MKRYTFLFIAFLLCSGSAFAQNSQTYVFGGIGGILPYPDITTHFGAGGDLLLYNGFGLNWELGYMSLGGLIGSGVGTAGLNGVYHFAQKGPWDPFITGGYTLFFREGTANLYNFGGGATYWKSRYGIRLEYRDHVWNYYDETEHFMDFRVALAFRF